ncbi:MAG TPA: hypothetical protein V6D43_17085 [Candidatus Sericytochromatia bacterium]
MFLDIPHECDRTLLLEMSHCDRSLRLELKKRSHFTTPPQKAIVLSLPKLFNSLSFQACKPNAHRIVIQSPQTTKPPQFEE